MSKIQTEETIPKFGSENLNGRITWEIYAYGRKNIKINLTRLQRDDLDWTHLAQPKLRFGISG